MDISSSLLFIAAFSGIVAAVAHTIMLNKELNSLKSKFETYRNLCGQWMELQEDSNSNVREFMILQDMANRESVKLFEEILNEPKSQKNPRIFESDN